MQLDVTKWTSHGFHNITNIGPSCKDVHTRMGENLGIMIRHCG